MRPSPTWTPASDSTTRTWWTSAAGFLGPLFRQGPQDVGGRLVGYIDIWELLRERDRDKPLGELVHRDFVAATVDMDQEEVAQLMNKYDLTVIPVVDADGGLVGRVTADDVMEVMEEEASEDIFRLAGSDDADLETESPFKSCAVRLPWLLVTLAGGAVTSLILRRFHEHITGVLILGAFVPVVLAMGGNTGIQSSTLVVRSLALGDQKTRGIMRLLGREIAVGALMGLICGALIGCWAHFMVARGPAPPFIAPALLAGVVSLALFAAMTFAAVFGAFVPIVLNRMRVDPAVASGPFITITNDIMALLLYFAVTFLLMHKLTGSP
ncbi:magnesium transporter [Verrucomicrobiota bacterium]